MEKNKLSFQLNADDFLPAGEDEKKSLVVMRESVGFWKDGMRRFKKNKIAMVSLIVVILIFILSFIVPQFYPYKYEQQIKGSNSLAPFEYSQAEQEAIANGEKVFPHILGTDQLGRDYAIRVMMGSRVSLTVGLVASAIILLIGSLYGSIAGFFGGWVDMVMMRIVDIIYTVPDVLIVILLAAVLNYPLKELAMKPGFEWIGLIGVNLISIFVVFALLYWVGMARIVRSQIMILKEQEYVTAARALGASSGSIIREAPANQLHRNSDCYDHASDSVIHLHGELLKLPGTGSKRPHAVSGQPCQRGLKRSAELSVSSVCPGSDDFHYHSEL